MNDSCIFAGYQVVWKTSDGKLYNVTEPEIGHIHQKNGILFVPADESTKYVFQPNTNKFLPVVFHIYSKKNLELPEEVITKVYKMGGLEMIL